MKTHRRATQLDAPGKAHTQVLGGIRVVVVMMMIADAATAMLMVDSANQTVRRNKTETVGAGLS
jgi:hypothetical protein